MCQVVACLAVVASVLLISSWSTIGVTEMGLKYNWVSRVVDPQAYIDPGLYFVSPFCTFIRYPKTVQTIEYDETHRDVLDGRTSDGLPLVLGVAFQYRLLPDKLFQLYHIFGEQNYQLMYNRMGIHLITEIATNFTAYQFFNTKQEIATEMTLRLNEFFSAHLFATVETLQINEDELPNAFLESVLRAATTKQNITRTLKVRDAAKVSMETEILVAMGKANGTLATAEGHRRKILADGKAQAAITEAYVDAEHEAYQIAGERLGLSGDALLDYIWLDTLGGGGVSGNGQLGGQMEVLVGVNPAAYISEAPA